MSLWAMRNSDVNPRDVYISSLFKNESDLKMQSRAAAHELGLARISVSSIEGHIISTLLKLHNSRKCIEVGTLTGLSAQYIFEAMPSGAELWTFEKSPEHASHAEKIFAQLDQQHKKIHMLVGDAKEELEKITSQGPFDAVFIDGNKAAYGDYLHWAEKNLRVGGLILADNIFLAGKVWGGEASQKFNDKQIQVMQDFNQRLADKKFYDSAIVPTHEGLFVAIKRF